MEDVNLKEQNEQYETDSTTTTLDTKTDNEKESDLETDDSSGSVGSTEADPEINKRHHDWGGSSLGLKLAGNRRKGKSLAKKKKAAEGKPLTSKSMRALQEQITELWDFTKTNRNVHKEVKTRAEELVSTFNAVKWEIRRDKTRCNTLIEQEEKARTEAAKLREELSIACKKIESLESEKKRLEESMESYASKITGRKTLKMDEWESRAKKCGNDEEVLAFLQTSWPKSAIKKVKTTDRDINRNRGDIAIYLPGRKEFNPTYQNIKQRYPELENADIEEDKYGCARVSYTASLEIDGEEIVKSRSVYKLLPKVHAEKEDRNEYRDLYYTLKDWGNTLARDGIRSITVLKPEGLKEEIVCQTLEWCLGETDIDITLSSEKLQKNKEGKTDPVNQTVAKVRRKDPALIVKAGGQNFAEVLKKVKSVCDTEDGSGTVKTVRKTAAGDLLLIADPRIANSMDKLREKINNVPELEVVTKKGKNRRSLHVLGIDGATSKEELLEKIKKSTNTTDVKVMTIRPAYGGSQNATVEVEDKAARELIRNGQIKIGWVICRIRERIEVSKCYRCQQWGHIRATCQGPDRSEVCYQCGKEGHKASQCDKTEAEYCVQCSKNGHRGGTGKCPAFRKAIQEGRGGFQKNY